MRATTAEPADEAMLPALLNGAMMLELKLKKAQAFQVLLSLFYEKELRELFPHFETHIFETFQGKVLKGFAQRLPLKINPGLNTSNI